MSKKRKLQASPTKETLSSNRSLIKHSSSNRTTDSTIKNNQLQSVAPTEENSESSDETRSENNDGAGKVNEADLQSQRKRSLVWRSSGGCFVVLERKEGKVRFAKCELCYENAPWLESRWRVSAHSGSTSKMKGHMERWHAELWRQLTGSTPSSTGPMKTFSKTVNMKKFSNQHARELLVKWVVRDDQPFTSVESESFKELLVYFNKDYQPISADTVKNDIKLTFAKYMSALKSVLKNVSSKISITQNIWTSPNRSAFLGVTGHYIDNDWNLVSVDLDFVQMLGSNTGVAIADALINSFSELRIEDKVLAITSDNTSSNRAAMRALVSKFETLGVLFNPEQQAVNFCPHTINLSAQSILKCLKAEGKEKEEEFSILQEGESDSAQNSVGYIVMKLRKFVITIRRSTKKADLFRKTCNTLDLEPQTMVIDVKTRWHSTYEMIECALSMKRAIVKFWSDTEVEGDVPFRKYKLSNDEWIILDKLKSILQPYNVATKILSQNTVPNMGSVIPAYHYLLGKLENAKLLHKDDPAFSEAIDVGYEILQSYYVKTDVNPSYFIAMMLDPRCKLEYFKQNGFEQYYIDRYERQFEAKYRDYAMRMDVDIRPNNPTPVNENELLSEMYGDSDTPVMSEVKSYLNSERARSNTNPLHYWKEKATMKQSVVLCQMAKDYLAICGSSIPSERLFSGGKNLISQTRCSLSPDTIRECMLLKGIFERNGFSEKLLKEMESLRSDVEDIDGLEE